MQSEASKKYRKSEKGKLQTKKEEAKNGRVRALKYSRSEKALKGYLKRIFNVDIEDWKRMHQIVGGRCVICGNQNEKGKRLCTDHNHKTGKFRGLLCSSCNKGLGCFKDNPILLERAAKYLQQNNETKDLVVSLFE